MIRILRADGSTTEEPRATTATLQGEYLVLRDRLGLLVATFDKHSVLSFADATSETSTAVAPPADRKPSAN